MMKFINGNKKHDDKPLEFQFFKNNTQADKIFRKFQSQWFLRRLEKENTADEEKRIGKMILASNLEITKTYESMYKIIKRIQENLERC